MLLWLLNLDFAAGTAAATPDPATAVFFTLSDEQYSFDIPNETYTFQVDND